MTEPKTKWIVEFFDGSYLQFLKPFVHRTLYLSKARKYGTAYGAKQALAEADKERKFDGAKIVEVTD